MMRYNKHGIPILDSTKNTVLPMGSTLRNSVFKKTKGRCFYCSRKLQNKNCNAKNYMTVDYVQPKFHLGTNNIHNLLPSCDECNRRKGHEELIFFIQRIQKMPENNFKFKRKLTIGETIKINGIPVKYLGNDDIGSDTDFVSSKTKRQNQRNKPLMKHKETAWAKK